MRDMTTSERAAVDAAWDTYLAADQTLAAEQLAWAQYGQTLAALGVCATLAGYRVDTSYDACAPCL